MFVVTGIVGGVLNPIFGAVEFERVPARLQARVLGAIKASAWVGIPFGALLGGYATEALGVRPAVLVFGAAYLLTTLAPFVFPAWRQLKRPVPAAAAESGAIAPAR
jgi:predicted MFS family arabinose efflux permease